MDLRKLLLMSILFFSSTKTAQFSEIINRIKRNHQWSYRNVWIIGDSHSAYCFTNYQNKVPYPNNMPKAFPTLYEQSIFRYEINHSEIIEVPFFIYWLGPRTMNRIGRDGIDRLNIKQIGVQENDVVVFVAGSIDRDGHVVRGKNNFPLKSSIQRQMVHREMDEIIDSLCTSYMNTILKNKKLYNNIEIVVASVLPVLIQPFMDNLFSEVFPNNSNISILDTEVMISRKMNATLEKYCIKNNFNFLNIHSLFEAKDGNLNPKLSDGHHINIQYNQPVKEQLISMLILPSI